jgi:hypothetical protein
MDFTLQTTVRRTSRTTATTAAAQKPTDIRRTSGIGRHSKTSQPTNGGADTRYSL